MKPIQPILTILLLIIFVLFYNRLRKYRFERILLTLTIFLGIVLVIMPDWASKMAFLVGISRGVDLIIYLGLVALMFMSLLYASKIREIEMKLTELTRLMAILTAENPPTFSENGELKIELEK